MNSTPEDKQKYIDDLKASMESEKQAEKDKIRERKQQEAEARKKKAEQWTKDHPWVAVIIAIVLVAAAVWVVWGIVFPESSEPTTSPQIPASTFPSYPTITYEITGSALAVDITLNNATGGTEQHSYVELPSSITYDNFTDNFLYISAQNQGDSGTVKVSIYVDGVLFKTSSSSGAYVIATASGSLP